MRIQQDGVDIIIRGYRDHAKASERYVDVRFRYPGKTVEWSVPIEYRRTGVHLSEASDPEIMAYLTKVYRECHPTKWSTWRATQSQFWATKPNAVVTKPFFDILASQFRWCSVPSDLPANPNWARRIQDLKEFGYTLAMQTRFDERLERSCTHLLLLPISRGGITGYEMWSQALRNRIVTALGSYDAFEARKGRTEGLLPDHKFPEIRWDSDTRRESLEGLSENEIRRDFQLMTNQRNQQKREVCRRCYQTGKRGYPYGIKFFYEGDENWPDNTPKRGKNAETGCVGCGWYDLERWRSAITEAGAAG